MTPVEAIRLSPPRDHSFAGFLARRAARDRARV